MRTLQERVEQQAPVSAFVEALMLIRRIARAAAPLASTPSQRATLLDIVRETSDLLAEVSKPRL